MKELTFDLSVPVSRLLLAGWSALGAIQVASGAFSIERGDDILGVVQIACGLFFSALRCSNAMREPFCHCV